MRKLFFRVASVFAFIGSILLTPNLLSCAIGAFSSVIVFLINEELAEKNG